MRIVHVVESLAVGGLERIVVALAAEQRSRGHSVTIVCLFRLGPLVDDAEQAGVSVACVDKRNGPDSRALINLRRLFRDAAPDVIHTHNAVAHYYTFVAAFGLGVRMLVNTRHGMGTFPFSRRREALFRLAMMRSRWCACVCESARSGYVRNHIVAPEKAVVVHNGIDISRFKPRCDEARRALLATLQLSPEAFVIGTVGRLTPAKDHATLLDGIARLTTKFDRIVLVIVGNGEARSSIEARIKASELSTRVRLLGERNDIPDLLTAFDLFVLSSRTEGYSVALVEAAAAALPMIATNVGGNADIVRHGSTGLLVPPQDPGAIADAILSLHADPNARHSMGTLAREWALGSGTLDSMADQYEALYRGSDLTGRKANRPDRSREAATR